MKKSICLLGCAMLGVIAAYAADSEPAVAQTRHGKRIDAFPRFREDEIVAESAPLTELHCSILHLDVFDPAPLHTGTLPFE